MLRRVYYDGNLLRWENRRMHTANVVFGEVLYEPGGVCGPRIQQDFELVYLHSGNCQVRLNQAIHDLKAGAVYLFRPGGREHFRFATDKETHHGFCSVRPGFISTSMQKRLAQAPFSVPCSEVFHVLLAAAFKLRPPRNRATSDLIDQLGVCAFAEFLNASNEVTAGASQHPAVLGFLRHVEDHFGEEECLLTAHQATGISRNALIYKFREEMHTTPARYLWKFRVERGAAMLAETGHTVAEIAYRCGFKNPFHFSRLVKKQLGQSPKTLRHHSWTKDSNRSVANRQQP